MQSRKIKPQLRGKTCTKNLSMPHTRYCLGVSSYWATCHMLGPKYFQEQNSLFQRNTLPQSIFKIKCQRNRISPVIGSIANGVREPLRRLHFFCGFTSYNHLHYNLLVVFKRNKNKNKQAHEQKPNTEISPTNANKKQKWNKRKEGRSGYPMWLTTSHPQQLLYAGYKWIIHRK